MILSHSLTAAWGTNDFSRRDGRTQFGWMNRSGWLLGYWYGAVCVVGLGFGLLGERRPFGPNILAHPFIVYAFAVTAGLLVLRVVRQQPVPELIPERALGFGCAAGVALFLAGNFIAVHLVGR